MEILTACISALIAATVSVFSLLINRKWQKEDNHDAVIERLDSLDKKLSDHIDYSEEQSIRECRNRILRFNDELLSGLRHSKDAFDMIIDDIGVYEAYCQSHPGFKNGIAAAASQNISRHYTQCMEDKSFLL